MIARAPLGPHSCVDGNPRVIPDGVTCWDAECTVSSPACSGLSAWVRLYQTMPRVVCLIWGFLKTSPCLRSCLPSPLWTAVAVSTLCLFLLVRVPARPHLVFGGFLWEQHRGDNSCSRPWCGEPIPVEGTPGPQDARCSCCVSRDARCFPRGVGRPRSRPQDRGSSVLS